MEDIDRITNHRITEYPFSNDYYSAARFNSLKEALDWLVSQEQDLSQFHGTLENGKWDLTITDTAEYERRTTIQTIIERTTKGK